MKFLLALLCVLLCLQALPGYIGELPNGAKKWVVGYVNDQDLNRLPDATITDGKQTVYSDSEGRFDLYDCEDHISVSRLGYQPVMLDVSDERISIESVILKSDPIILPTVRVTAKPGSIFGSSPDLVRIPIDPDRRYNSPVEILALNPGVRSSDVQLKGESQSISILGNLSRHTLVIVDGVPLNPNGEAYDLSLIDPANIESVELIKNNASAYGGGSAIGGIVQITTKKAKSGPQKQFTLLTELGSFSYANSGVSLAISRSIWSMRLNASNMSTRNDFRFSLPDWWAADSTALRTNNAKRQRSISGSVNLSLLKANLILQSDYSSFRRELPGTVNFLDVYRHAFLEGYNSRNYLKLELDLGGWDNVTRCWFNLDNTQYDNTRAPLPVFESLSRQKMSGWGVNSVWASDISPSLLPYSLMGSFSVLGEAAGRRYRNIDLLTSVDDINYQASSAAAALRTELEWDLDLYKLSGSGVVRYDYTDREDNLTWRLDGMLTHNGWLYSALGFSAGNSFAQPSPYDLYWRGDSQTIGNPDLQSELSQGWKVWGQTGYNGIANIKAAFYHNTIENLIQWRQVQMYGNVWKPLNVGKAQRRNLEGELTLTPWDWLKLTTTALYTQALDLSDPAAETLPELTYSPDFTLSVNLDVKWKNLSFWSKYSFTGEQWTTPDNLSPRLPAYGLLDMGASWQFKTGVWNITPFLSVRNALNERYEIYAYVPQPGMAFYGGVSLSVEE